MNDFDNHLFQCPLKYGKICDKCHLAFDPKNYKQHNCDQSVVVVRKSVVTSTVYKCVQCDLHYLNRRSVRYHLEQDHCCLSKIIACEICNLRFPERSNKRHKEIHDSMKKQYMIKVVDCIGSYTIVKGYNHKNYNRTTLTNDCDDNPTNDTETTLDSSFKIKKEITETPTIAIKQEIDEEDISVGVTILYRCNSCNICYHFKKTYHYHLEMNHVNKRGVIECPICCLPFTQNSLNNHARVHETGDEYVIHVQEMDQGKVTEFRGINTKVDVKMAVPKKEVKKRPAEYPVSPLTMKTRKSNKRNVLTLDESHEISPSKIDFESVNMANEDKINTDLSNEYSNDVTDPLVYSSEMVVPDDLDNTDDITNKESGEVSEQVLSSKMKGLLYAKIKNYSHVLYRCVLCNVDFLTAMSIVSHFKRTDHKKPFTALNCDECGFPFSVFTLARHKYIHHVLMKLSTDDMYVLPVPEEYDTKQKIGELLQNTLGDAQEIDDTTEEDMDIDGNATNKSIENTRENIRDANTDEVNMEVDETIVNNSQIHIYQPNSETQNDVTEISNAQENVAERVNLEEKVQKETKIHYYKCADCNVCFIKEELCKTHCVEHKKLDPRLYIECKMCNFQFSLESLMEHVTLHHDTEFCLEDLAVTEYTAGTDGHIKVDTYLGIDKVQSRLVSTTTDLTDVKSITPVNIESSS